MINCYILDDMPAQFKLLAILINRHPELNFVGAGSDAVKFLDAHQSGELSFDLLFLDIEMPGIMGIDVAKLLAPPIKVIFVTGHRDYAVEAFELNAIDYLVKPIHPKRFEEAIEKVLLANEYERLSNEKDADDRFLVIKGSGKASWLKLEYEKIVYLKANSNYTDVYYDDKKHTIYGTLGSLESKLETSKFMRIHRSFVVNLDHVQKGISNDRLIMSNEHEVPIGKVYSEGLKSFLTQHLK